MNHQYQYNKIIEKAKNRESLKCYKEEHHIIPLALDGSDKKENKVKLTGREHFICHLLLAKIYGGKMIYPLFLMFTLRKGKKLNSRIYEWLRIECATLMRASKKGKKLGPQSEEHKKKRRESIKIAMSDLDVRKKLSESKKGEKNPRFNKRYSMGERKEMSERFKGSKNPNYGKRRSFHSIS